MSYEPPCTLTDKIFNLSQEIKYFLGKIDGEKLLPISSIKLRKNNNIRTIHASLAIEGNTLSLEQITAILEGRKVFGPEKEITEVKNAIELYQSFDSLNLSSKKDLLKAHKILMSGLVNNPGKIRSSHVAIFGAHEIAHLPPPYERVSGLIDDLFHWLKKSVKSPLIKACIFHYELEFIHPFEDGNGRIGRLCQQLILSKENSIFKYVSIEELIHDNQKKYYKALGDSDKQGDSATFVEFMLELILKTLKKFDKTSKKTTVDSTSRLQFAKEFIKNKTFSRKEYLNIHKDISTATASKDLRLGAQKNIILKEGDKITTKYKFLMKGEAHGSSN